MEEQNITIIKRSVVRERRGAQKGGNKREVGLKENSEED